MRGRSKRETPSVPKPAPVPDKLAKPFAESLKAIKADFESKAELTKAKAEADRKVGKAPKRMPTVAPVSRTNPPRIQDAMGHYDYGDRAAFHQAYGDVRPIAKPKGHRSSGLSSLDTLRRLLEIGGAAAVEAESLLSESVDIIVELDSDHGLRRVRRVNELQIGASGRLETADAPG